MPIRLYIYCILCWNCRPIEWFTLYFFVDPHNVSPGGAVWYLSKSTCGKTFTMFNQCWFSVGQQRHSPILTMLTPHGNPASFYGVGHIIMIIDVYIMSNYMLRSMPITSQHCQPVPHPVDKLPIKKTGEAPVWSLHTLIWLSSMSSGVQSICDAEKMYGRHR